MGLITKEMVSVGFQTGVIRLRENIDDASGIVCAIGGYWFYFGDENADTMSLSEYVSITSREKIVELVYSVLQEMENWNEDEYLYYFFYLTDKNRATGVFDKNGKKLYTKQKVKFFEHEGVVDYCCGAYGVYSKKGIDYDQLASYIEELTGCANEPHFCYVDNFVSFYELMANFGSEDNCVLCTEIIHE